MLKVKDLLLQAALKTPDGETYDRNKSPMTFATTEGVQLTLSRVPTLAEAKAEAEKNPLSEALRRYGKAIGLDEGFVDATVDGHVGMMVGDTLVIIERPKQSGKTEELVRRIMRDNDILAGMPFSREIRKKLPLATRAYQEISRAGWNFTEKHFAHLAGRTVNLVGIQYAPDIGKETFATKRVGNMCLLVPEPDGHDVNGLMVLMWSGTRNSWHQVGYVQREQAAELRSAWPEDDLSRVAVAHATHWPVRPDGHRGGDNVRFTLSGQTRKYPAYRA